MSKVVRAVVGAVIVVAAFFVPGAQFLLPVGISLLGSALLTPSNKQQERQAAAVTLQLGEVPRQAIFGEVVLGGNLLDAINYGGQYGTDWEVLDIALADHRCHALLGLYVNDTYVAFGGGVGAPWTVPGYNGQLVITWHEGAATQAADGTMVAQAGWSADDKLSGVAHVVVAYKADDSKAKNPIWTGGRPRFKWHVQGALCYDPRLDDTVAGGAGAHRRDDPATWAYSDNPIICRYNWVRGVYACDRVTQPEQLLVGRGLSATEAPAENVAWRANICDEMVALAAGGSEKRYRCGVIVSADEQFINIEEMWAATVAGVIRQPQGSVEVDPGYAVTPTFAITDDDLITGAKVTFNGFRSEADSQWVNTVIPRYVEPAQLWADHAAPIRRNYADVLADGGARESTLSLGAVHSGTQAQRCGEIARRMGRLVRSGAVVLGPRFAGIEDGDWGIWTSARHTGGLPMTVRVESYGIDEKWQNSLTLREVSANAFAWSTADEIAPGAVAEANNLPTFGTAPDVGDWSLTGGAVPGPNGAQLPALILTGEITDAYASEMVTEYREVIALTAEDGSPILSESGEPIVAEGSEGTWQVGPTVLPGATSVAITSIKPRGLYEVAVSYRVRGAIGERLVLGPATADDLTVARACYTINGIDPHYPITSDDTHIYVAACTATLDDGRTMDFPAAALGGLANSTCYGVFWRFSTGAFEVMPTPALADKASSDCIFFDWFFTANGTGTYDPVDPPPDGYGGDGRREIKAFLTE